MIRGYRWVRNADGHVLTRSDDRQVANVCPTNSGYRWHVRGEQASLSTMGFLLTLSAAKEAAEAEFKRIEAVSA